MARFAYKMSIAPCGEGLHIALHKRFAEQLEIRPKDFVLPAVIKSKHYTDPKLGEKKQLVFFFRRDNKGVLFETLDEVDSDTYD